MLGAEDDSALGTGHASATVGIGPAGVVLDLIAGFVAASGSVAGAVSPRLPAPVNARTIKTTISTTIKMRIAAKMATRSQCTPSWPQTRLAKVAAGWDGHPATCARAAAAT